MFVQRGKKQYGYRSYRRGEQVCKQYLGNISSKKSQDFVQEQKHKKEVKNKRKMIQSELNKLIKALDEFSDITNIVMRSFLVENNNYLRKSEIRRMKYEE